MRKLKFIITLMLIIVYNGSCYADTVPGSGVMPVNQVFAKFALTMGAVFLSVLIIWVGLYIFKGYVKDQYEKARSKMMATDSNETPKNVDEAVVSFINKNKL